MAPALEVALCVHAETSFGETVCAVGGAQALGGWSPGAGVALLTDPGSYPQWLGTVQLPGSECFDGCVEFKFVILRQDGSACWEPGPNRRLVVQQAATLLCADGGHSAPTLRFGETTSEEVVVVPPASLPLLKPPAGVKRTDSIASTCVLLDLEEDALSTTVSSRCASWSNLPQEDSISPGASRCASASNLLPLEEEELPPSLALWAGAHRTPKPEGRCEDSFFFSALGAGVANLGDSGFLHLRAKAWGMEVVERSREQNHGWNCPYQLTRVPEALARSCGARLDTAADCQRYQLSVEAGDLLLLYTDGLTDNLHWYEIMRIVDDTVGQEPARSERRSLPEDIARALVLAAQERSLDTEASTPFERSARRHHVGCPGGKADDITVVAAWVLPDSDGRVATQVSELGLPHCASSRRELRLGA